MKDGQHASIMSWVSRRCLRSILWGARRVAQRGVPAAVMALLRYASEHGIAIVPRGAATNLSAAIAPSDDSLMLDLASMNRIVEIDAQARRAVVEPGVINADLKTAVAPLGLVYAPDPASTPISTIGGNIAENAGGPGCIKYGVTFHHVLAVDVALADGRLVTFSDDDEVDLLGVTIGSEGILDASSLGATTDNTRSVGLRGVCVRFVGGGC